MWLCLPVDELVQCVVPVLQICLTPKHGHSVVVKQQPFLVLVVGNNWQANARHLLADQHLHHAGSTPVPA